MSEHEGFCVPLLEAMHFNVPIVAYNSSAVGETLGSGGLLVSNKDWVAIAALMNQVLEDDSLKMRVLNAQRKRRAAYSKTNTQKIWWDYLQCLL
ncbi:glycosyltransferase [Paenibacillus larvae]|nr:glycosyltransferase [Paenibacillus larvae]MDT2192402.1 glycosyltransferase [Paenibacillus larvae]MDT2239700.1 glycosyltransferase [Paenibacillus larvae]MDT2246348.1 glycosyltransferase [Paenibacillus larvae]MDT2292920.1 glycosyltransferase [Paenibacillus larvae]